MILFDPGSILLLFLFIGFAAALGLFVSWLFGDGS